MFTVISSLLGCELANVRRLTCTCSCRRCRSSEKLVARRASERREQYRQVRAHVRKEDGRLQAYGWSLPGKPSAPVRQPVPVPVYCRPLQETEPGMKVSVIRRGYNAWTCRVDERVGGAKSPRANGSCLVSVQIWCGAGVNMSGGKTRDGGSMVGGSVFYAAEARETSGNARTEAEDAVEHLDKELQENEKRLLEAERLEQQLSSLVWICTSTQKMSKVTVIDANNPADILEVFNVCQGHLLCIASVPGAKESDYAQLSNENSIRTANGTNDSENNNGVSEDVTNANEAVEHNGQRNYQDNEALVDKSKSESDNPTEDQANENTEKTTGETDQNSTNEAQSLESIDSETANLGKVHFVRCNVSEATSSRSNGKDAADEETQNEEVAEETPIEKMSSIQPTMWLGAQNGAVFVHSAVAKWSVCLHSVKLRDAALAIVYVTPSNEVNEVRRISLMCSNEIHFFFFFFFFLDTYKVESWSL